jgi:hypothetical protein
MKIPYEVIDANATEIGGERVEGGIVRMTPEQAEHWLRMGAIMGLEAIFTPHPETPQAGVDVIDEVTAGVAPRHPLDHDGDGRPGGSKPGRRRKKKASKEPLPWEG